MDNMDNESTDSRGIISQLFNRLLISKNLGAQALSRSWWQDIPRLILNHASSFACHLPDFRFYSAIG